jgi:cyclopropane fatty-acyl-phospholipid synthase-like methyltransferase
MTDTTDARSIVEAGYDAVAGRYAALEQPGKEWPRMRWLERLLSKTREGSRVLDVGCGNGVPAPRAIAERFEATGIDISAAQVEQARRNVPEAEFLHADLMKVDFDVPFAAISAFYLIEHVPRERHGAIFERFHRWLEPGGHLLFTIEPFDEPGIVGDWLGKPMFFSQHTAEKTLELVIAAGFQVIESDVETQLEGGREVSYLWVLARRR